MVCLNPCMPHLVLSYKRSPPCQPFTTTKNAKQKDSEDRRCDGIKYLMKMLYSILEKPRWILLENVKGFVGSNVLDMWYKCLGENGYSWEEYLLSPTQFGIPNHRKRYYILCERSNRFRKGQNQQRANIIDSTSVSEDVPNGSSELKEPCTIAKYLQDPREINLNSYIISDSVLQKKWANQIGVVSSRDKLSHCFTAAYGRQIHKATGSILLMDIEREKSLLEDPLDRSDMMCYSGMFRRFTPRELLRIFGYPDHFCFPDNISLEHQYKLIGNSVNVTVIAHLVECLIENFYG